MEVQRHFFLHPPPPPFYNETNLETVTRCEKSKKQIIADIIHTILLVIVQMWAQSANSWAHSAIDNPQMSLVGQSVNRKIRKEINPLMCQSANRKSANLFSQ